MPKYILVNRPFKPEQLSRIQAIVPGYRVIQSVEEIEHLTDIEIVFGWNEGSEVLLKENNEVKWIQTTSAGVNYLPLDMVAEQGIQLTAANGVHSGPITESVFAVLLSYLRSIFSAYDDQEDAIWNRPTYLPELRGKTMMIVGVGNIGRHMATVAKTFGVKTIGINRSGRDIPEVDEQYVQSELGEKIYLADIVVNILPATPETKDIYNEAIFQAMKDQTIFMNVGRGDSVVDEDLIQALDNGKVAFAALDVFREEPLPKDNPYWAREDVLVLSHMTSMQEDYYERVIDIFEENAVSFQETGKALRNVINLSEGY